MFSQIMDMINSVFTSGVGWFTEVITRSGMFNFYMAIVFLTILYRFILRPLFVTTIYSGASDTVQGIKYESRSHGRHEKNYVGKFSNKR